MKAKDLKFATMDDLVFEGRNKAYGAYQLRQDYENHLAKAFCFSLTGVLALLALLYGAIQLKPDLVSNLIPPAKAGLKVEIIDPVFEKTNPPQAPEAPVKMEPASSPSTTATIQATQPRIVSDIQPVVEEYPEQAQFAQANPGLVTATGTPADGTAGKLPAESGGGNETGLVSEKPFDFVEQMPDYADGGMAGMMKFIGKNLRYPSAAVANGIEGIVVVSFVINSQGEVTQVSVLKDLGAGTAAEAMRVVSKMPRWKPGVQNHRNVSVRMTLPIRFKLG